MKTHATLSELTPDDVDVFRTNFVHELRRAEGAMSGGIGMVAGRLSALDPTSVEYALAVSALATDGQTILRQHWSQLMRYIAEIRPASTGGRMREAAPPPEKFAGTWPHRRLGHKSWTAFVEAPVGGKRKPGDERAFNVPPGLGLSKQYESNLFSGWQKLHGLIAAAMPEASQEERDAKLDAIVERTGPATVAHVGQSKVTPGSNFSAPEARAAVDSLAAGAVAKADVAARGLAALTDPRPKGQRKKAAAAPAEASGDLPKAPPAPRPKDPVRAAEEAVGALEPMHHVALVFRLALALDVATRTRLARELRDSLRGGEGVGD